MSATTAPHTAADAENAVTAKPRRPLPAWTREPLLHFVLIGAALFAADYAFLDKADDPNTIVLGADVDREARELFKSTRGSDPTPEQLAALRQNWLDNEVLYREGMALRMDQGDTAIRDRVVFKALNIVESNLRLPPVDAKTLQAWFEKNRDKYDQPARYDFQEATPTGDASEGAVRALVDELNRNTGGDVKAALRIFKDRPHSNLVQSYGEPFARTLEKLAPGSWRAMQTPQGWRAMRLEAITPGKAADFTPLAAVVQQDWTDETMAEMRTAAVRELAKKYRVRIEGGKP